MASAIRNGYSWPTICGGQGTCKTCVFSTLEGGSNLARIGSWEEQALASSPVAVAWQARRQPSPCFDPTNLRIDNCYEINIWDDHPNQQHRTGAIVQHASPPLVALDTVGQWNRYRISASPSRVSVWLNGTLTAQIDDPVLKDGYIALQSVNGVVKFRRLKITPASPYKPTIDSERDQ